MNLLDALSNVLSAMLTFLIVIWLFHELAPVTWHHFSESEVNSIKKAALLLFVVELLKRIVFKYWK